MAEIRRSGLIVADFTGNRGGVYFEAGFAMGLGLPVIWTVRQDDIDAVHFDTRQYNHITWSTPQELREKLYNRVMATIGGPRSN
jgi:nucleoside 2-deoxyribosyltransferase